MPYYYHEKKNQFYTKGVFCSFPCMKRYNIDRTRSSTMQEKISSLISFMYKRLNGKIDKGIKPAPTLDRLSKFGGGMTIQAYRDSQGKTMKGAVSMRTMQEATEAPPLAEPRVKKTASTMSAGSTRSEQAAEKIKNAKKSDILGTPDSLRLKRQKRLESHSGNQLMSTSLLNTLGIVVKDND